MRILRLIQNDGYALELHPYVTVVTDLTDNQREEVRRAFREASSGRAPALGGLIEAHGMVLDLDGASLDLLELAGVEVDVVVGVDDLPGAATGGVGRQLRSAERRLAELDEPRVAASRRVEEAERRADEAHDLLKAARDAAESDDGETAKMAAEVEALEAELRQAERTVESLAEPASRAAGALQQAERTVEQAEERRDSLSDESPDALRARRMELGTRRETLIETVDDQAANALDNALAELAEAREALAHAEAAALARAEAAGHPRPRADEVDGANDEADADPDDSDDPADTVEEEEEQEEEGEEEAGDDEERAELERRIEEIRGILALHESFDPEPVHAALDAIRLTPAAGALVPSPEALGLAHRIEELTRRAHEDRMSDDDDDDSAVPLPGEIDAATTRLDGLRSRVVELERAEPSSGGPEADIAELERAHSEVVEAREGLSGRFGKGRAQSRLDAALEVERAVLDRLGFGSYTDFMTGGRSALARPAESDELRTAKAEAREAEIELRELLAAVDRDLARTEVIEDLQGVQRQAQQLLGDDSLDGQELIDALLDLRVPSEATTPVQELQTALASVGLALDGLDLGADDVTAMAADWLDEYHRAEDRRSALVAELAELQAQLDGDPQPTHAPPPAPAASPAFAMGESSPVPLISDAALEPSSEAGFDAGAEDGTDRDSDAEEPESPGFALPFASDAPGEDIGFALPFASDGGDQPAGFGLPFADDESAPDAEITGDASEVAEAVPEVDVEDEPEVDVDVEDEPEVAVEPEVEVEPDDEPGSPADDDPASDQPPSLAPDDVEEIEATKGVIADAEARVEAAKARVVAHEAAARELAEVDAELAALAARMTDVDEVADLVDDAVRAVEVATSEYLEIEAGRAEAEREVVRLRSEIESRRQGSLDEPSPEQLIADAESAAAEADEALRAAREELDRSKEDYDSAAVEVSALRQTVAELEQQPAPVEEIEWYLLARLAGQRHVSFAGSVPLVIDGALDEIDDEGKRHLLGRLERMAGAVQVVHLSDDPGVLDWARKAGDERVAVVSPVPAREQLPADS